jgi:3-dehydrotetronate 4-kinase
VWPEAGGAEGRDMILGCIADDFTGATDLANMLSRQGMHVVQVIGVPEDDAPEADAIVVALKSRTIPADMAVAQSIAACRWLRRHGARQIFFKYCSTFDSTDAGNIGPVADALLGELNSPFTIACPAFPENGRSIYMGHLFVGRDLLSDSSMRHHPLTPMTDANLVRVLGRQTPSRVGLVPQDCVARGPAQIRAAFGSLQSQGFRHAIVDAVSNDDLMGIGEACADLALVTGGSGVAMGLPQNFRAAGLLPAIERSSALPGVGGDAAIISGSCSAATLAQVAAFRDSGGAAFAVDARRLAHEPEAVVEEALAYARAQSAAGPVLVFSTASPETVKAIQADFGRENAGERVEHALAAIAQGLVRQGVRRLVVAGGETAGAVVQALGVSQLMIGPQIAPGVPATLSIKGERLALVLKSGNFGGPDFFREALKVLT